MPPPKPKKNQKPRQPKRKTTKVPQPSESTNIAVDEVVHKERVIIWYQDTIGDTSAHTRKVKKLEKKHRSRTHKLKRLFKVGLTARVISSSDDEALDKEDTSKQGRIDEINADEDIALVISATKTIVTTALTITAESTKTIVEVTQAPMRKRVMIQKPKETTTIKTASLQQPQIQDKSKGKEKLIDEPEMPKKRKHQIRADKELVKKLQAKMQAEIDEENRLARERAQKEQESNDELINTWNDIQTKIDANA
nr:hypothetical protein [Tanacetum cinerariifolium]